MPHVDPADRAKQHAWKMYTDEAYALRVRARQQRYDRKTKKKPVDIRKRNLKRYGLTLESYAAMHSAQGGVCAICGNPEATRNQFGPNSLAVDHNHETGEVRALLCMKCNHGLGAFRDDPELLAKAVEYLKRHS